MEMGSLDRARAERLVLTFVSFESVEACLPDDVYPVYYYINPNCPTKSTFAS